MCRALEVFYREKVQQIPKEEVELALPQSVLSKLAKHAAADTSSAPSTTQVFTRSSIYYAI